MELCRICAAKCEPGVPIHSEGGYLPYKIKFVLNIEVSRSDDKKFVCSLCSDKINDFHDYKQMARDTQAQGIGVKKDNTDFKIKIKEEPKDFSELADQVASLPRPNSAPLQLIPLSSLPFLLKQSNIKSENLEDKAATSSPLSDGSEESVDQVDDLINQVNTDEDSKGADADGPEPAAPDTSASVPEPAQPAAPDTSSPDTSAPEPSAPDSTAESGRRRGRKRLPSSSSEEEVSKRRLTRSSTGVLQKKKIIVDESEDDDDVDDPEYKTKADEDEDDDDEDDDDDDEEDKASPTEAASESSKSPEVKAPKTQPEGTCVKCEKHFPSTVALESHQMKEHFNETWYCYDCLCGFPNFKTWKYHKRNFCKKTAVIRICTKCQSTFKSYEELRLHSESCKGKSENSANKSPVKQSPSKDKPLFRCSFCSIETDNNTEFLEHLKVHKKSSVSVLKCSQCDKTFKEKGALICHKEFHHKNTKQVIKVNDTSATNATEKTPIIKSSKEYKCNTCDENFQSSGKLICHQVLVHKKK